MAGFVACSTSLLAANSARGLQTQLRNPPLLIVATVVGKFDKSLLSGAAESHKVEAKIKIDSPDFKCTNFSYDKPYRLTMSTYNGGLGGEVQIRLFKKNGKPVLKRSIEELESFVNTLSNAIVDAAKGKADTEEW